MNIYAPEYYNSFKCIADKCMHSCCIGWEIDIDDETLELYKSINNDFGERILNSISIEDETPHFLLSTDERCPFLDQNNLCDIIKNLGHESLCQICSDHPRFRNFFSDRIEIGLGLCCEEACKIILTNMQKTNLIPIKYDNEEFLNQEEINFLKLRNDIFEILQNRNKKLDERISEIAHFIGIEKSKKTFKEWINFYLSLENLDKNWNDRLKSILNNDKSCTNFCCKNQIAFEQLIIYFIYRHLADGIYDDTLKIRISFSLHAAYMIKNICADCNDINQIIDIARQYSSEIEYSEENIERILNALPD